MLAAASVGFLDATFLTVEHYLHRIPPCTSSGCEIVTTSVYSTVFGIPISLLGALYYVTIIVALVYVLDSGNRKVLRAACRLTVAGLLASATLVSLMVFVIHALCLYCLFSAVSSTTLFILGMVVLKKK